MTDITIFTPTYNRAYKIDVLFESLLSQTKKNSFEWLIVDDGSTDGTKELIAAYEAKADFPVRYYHQENKGKQAAVNYGLKLAKGSLFFIVDSDDFLTSDAVEQISEQWQAIKNNDNFAGLCFRRKNYNTNTLIGSKQPEKIFDSNSIDIVFKYKVSGDKAEIFKTDILKEYPFPEIKNEKFVPEAYIWNRIALKYKLRFVDEAIYMCDYLEDGYSANFKKNLKNNPKGFCLFYKDVLGYKGVSFSDKLKALIRIIQTKIYLLAK